MVQGPETVQLHSWCFVHLHSLAKRILQRSTNLQSARKPISSASININHTPHPTPTSQTTKTHTTPPRSNPSVFITERPVTICLAETVLSAKWSSTAHPTALSSSSTARKQSRTGRKIAASLLRRSWLDSRSFRHTSMLPAPHNVWGGAALQDPIYA